MFEDEIILNELDEVTEVIFFTNGKFDLGFDINSRNHFILRY